jgi:hypothetical protein
MANKPKELAAEEIARVSPGLIWGWHCPCTDPAVGGVEHTEFFLEKDKPTQNRLMAIRLEAEANVIKALGEGFAKMASAMKGNG